MTCGPNEPKLESLQGVSSQPYEIQRPAGDGSEQTEGINAKSSTIHDPDRSNILQYQTNESIDLTTKIREIFNGEIFEKWETDFLRLAFKNAGFGQKYTFSGRIFGRGSEGTVFEVTNQKLSNRFEAMKVFNPSSSEIDKALEQAGTMIKLANDSPDIANHLLSPHDVLDVVDKHVVYSCLTMAPVGDGRTLLTLINELYEKKNQPRFTENLAAILQMISIVASVLDSTSEKQLSHGDVKPSNILVNDWDPMSVKVGDWQALSVPTNPCGFTFTPAYCCLAQARDGIVDATTDVYLLGSTLFHVITNSPPRFYKPTKTRIFGRLSFTDCVSHQENPDPKGPGNFANRYPHLAAVVRRATDSSVEGFYKDAGQFKTGIEQILDQPNRRSKTRRRVINISLVLGAVLFAGLATWALSGKDSAVKISVSSLQVQYDKAHDYFVRLGEIASVDQLENEFKTNMGEIDGVFGLVRIRSQMNFDRIGKGPPHSNI